MEQKRFEIFQGKKKGWAFMPVIHISRVDDRESPILVIATHTVSCDRAMEIVESAVRVARQTPDYLLDNLREILEPLGYRVFIPDFCREEF